MKHKQKVKLAKKLSGLTKGYFSSDEWKARKARIADKVLKREARQQEASRLRKENKNEK